MLKNVGKSGESKMAVADAKSTIEAIRKLEEEINDLYFVAKQ